MRRLLYTCSALSVLALPAAAAAQESGSVAVLGGVTSYDLSGTGTVAFASFRGSSALDRPLVIEGALGWMPYFTQGDEQVNNLFPEAQVQLQWLRSRVRPYVGVGVGAAYAWSGDASATDATLSAAGGVRWPVRTGWALQGELRLRAVDPWTGTTADFGVGVAGRF